MAKDSTQLNVVVDDGLMAQIERHMELNGFARKGDAVRSLLRAGLSCAAYGGSVGQAAEWACNVVDAKMRCRLNELGAQISSVEDALDDLKLAVEAASVANLAATAEASGSSGVELDAAIARYMAASEAEPYHAMALSELLACLGTAAGPCGD